MPANVNNNVAVGQMAAAVLKDDPVLRNQLQTLVQDAIGHMQYTMRHGMAAEKAQVYKAIAPHLLTAMQTQQRNEQREKEREAYDRMLKVCRGELTPDQYDALETPAIETIAS